nr:EOG090X027A [Eulimnadia texana]
MATRKRSSSGSKKQLKEKIIQIYEALFRGEDQSLGNPNFWDEFFLLKPKPAFISSELLKLSAEQLATIKDIINTISIKSIAVLGHEHHIRVAHSLQTLCAIVKGIYERQVNDVGCDVVDLIVGASAAELQLQLLIEHCCDIIVGENPVTIKELCLKLLLLVVTGMDNIAQNTIVEHLMLHSVFEALVQIFCQPSARIELGHDDVLLLTLLTSCKKPANANPYVVKLSMLDDELALTGYAQVIMAALSQFIEKYVQARQVEPQSSWLSSLTSMVGSMFVSDEAEQRTGELKANDAALLALYQAVHLNRHFVGLLAQSQAELNPRIEKVAAVTGTEAESSGATSAPNSTAVPSEGDVSKTAPVDLTSPTSNLLATFLEYCSIVMQDTRSEAAYHSTKLCFLILTCVSEDEYANSLMHDAGLTFRVPLHRLPMRHRKVNPEKSPPFRPLVCGLLDLVNEFILSHLMKKFPHELYDLALGIVLRVLCHQKRCRLRLALCPWRDLWSALIALLKFLHSSDLALVRKFDLFGLATQAVNIFNLFITFGDTFLPSPQSYDDLYYEIIRMHVVFDNLHAMALRYSTGKANSASLRFAYRQLWIRFLSHLLAVPSIVTESIIKRGSLLAKNSNSSGSKAAVVEVIVQTYCSFLKTKFSVGKHFQSLAIKPKKRAKKPTNLTAMLSYSVKNGEISLKDGEEIQGEKAFMVQEYAMEVAPSSIVN